MVVVRWIEESGFVSALEEAKRAITYGPERVRGDLACVYGAQKIGSKL